MISVLPDRFRDFAATDWRCAERYYREVRLPTRHECIVRGCQTSQPLVIPPIHRQVEVRLAF